MKKNIFRFVALLGSMSLPLASSAEEKRYTIYQDADLSHHAESSEAIQKGIELAFDEVGNVVDGYAIDFKYLDHRGNVVRSKINYETFLADEHALAIYSGVHSPPLIKNRAFINENEALTLVPWAAGAPITRYPSSKNWVFRLSVDDTFAGPVLIDFAMNDKKCKSPHLLLENTPWGESNLKSMSKALATRGKNAPNVTRFSWNIKNKAAHTLLRKIRESGDDCIMLVANAIEGTLIINAMTELPLKKRTPIISHWGITGGKFHETITAEKRTNLDLHFIQTCYAFTNATQTEFQKRVFSQLKEYMKGDIKAPKDLKAAVGFIHGYDITKLFIAAIKQAGLTGVKAHDANAIRIALENLKAPVQGLVKKYTKPYSTFNATTHSDAHEALHTNDYCMGYYGPDDEILLVGKE